MTLANAVVIISPNSTIKAIIANSPVIILVFPLVNRDLRYGCIDTSLD